VTEINSKLLLPNLEQLVELGDCEKILSSGKNEREIDLHFYHNNNYICPGVQPLSQRILKLFCVLIIKQYQEFMTNPAATNPNDDRVSGLPQTHHQLQERGAEGTADTRVN
jgi:hypothetical protein